VYLIASKDSGEGLTPEQGVHIGILEGFGKGGPFTGAQQGTLVPAFAGDIPHSWGGR
jgi:hypothetical protein